MTLKGELLLKITIKMRTQVLNEMTDLLTKTQIYWNLMLIIILKILWELSWTTLIFKFMQERRERIPHRFRNRKRQRSKMYKGTGRTNSISTKIVLK